MSKWEKTNITALKHGYYWHWVRGLKAPMLLHIGTAVVGLIGEEHGEGYYFGPIEPPALPVETQ